MELRLSVPAVPARACYTTAVLYLATVGYAAGRPHSRRISGVNWQEESCQIDYSHVSRKRSGCVVMLLTLLRNLLRNIKCDVTAFHLPVCLMPHWIGGRNTASSYHRLDRTYCLQLQDKREQICLYQNISSFRSTVILIPTFSYVNGH
jgi:hypothetical protein